MIVFAEHLTSRLQYVVDFLSHYYDTPFLLTDDPERFKAYDAGRINYSGNRVADAELVIKPAGLLNKKGIEPLEPEVANCNGIPSVFINNSDIGFDLFSGIFYFLTRYEEYLPHEKDIYGRYAHENSIAYRRDFIKQPLVDLWLNEFPSKLKIHSGHTVPSRNFTYTPTYDIDIAWSYKQKGLLRNAGGILRSLLKGKTGEIKERLSVLFGKKEDPFNSYYFMEAVHRDHQLDPIYFFHVGKRRSKFDKNIPPADPAMQELIRTIGAKHEIGLHPSWDSGDTKGLLSEEKNLLENICGRKIDKSRQHYIRFSLPGTYRELIAAGIKEDYSMGYGSINGFRASIGSSFFWYDLEKEEKTDLLIKPFCYMDANTHYEQKEGPETGLNEMRQFHHVLHHCGADMITIFHNNFLGNGREFEGWKEAYADFLATAR